MHNDLTNELAMNLSECFHFARNHGHSLSNALYQWKRRHDETHMHTTSDYLDAFAEFIDVYGGGCEGDMCDFIILIQDMMELLQEDEDQQELDKKDALDMAAEELRARYKPVGPIQTKPHLLALTHPVDGGAKRMVTLSLNGKSQCYAVAPTAREAYAKIQRYRRMMKNSVGFKRQAVINQALHAVIGIPRGGSLWIAEQGKDVEVKYLR